MNVYLILYDPSAIPANEVDKLAKEWENVLTIKARPTQWGRLNPSLQIYRLQAVPIDEHIEAEKPDMTNLKDLKEALQNGREDTPKKG